MILFARLDPVPCAVPQLALPEPRGALQVVHAEIDRVDRITAVERGGRDADDGLARAHQPDPVDHEQAHEGEAGEGAVGESIDLIEGHPFATAIGPGNIPCM